MSQLKLIMDILTKASVSSGKTFLHQDEADTAKLFQTIFNSELDERAVFQLPQQARAENAPKATEENAQNAESGFDEEVLV